jgi:hypothetical protein
MNVAYTILDREFRNNIKPVVSFCLKCPETLISLSGQKKE